jgi:hypothetical protein
MRDVRLILLMLVAALALATAAAASSPVHATMSTSSTQAIAGTPWRYTIVVKDQAGNPLAARVRLQLLRGTLVVSCWRATTMVQCAGARAGTWISFDGTRTGVIRWPAKSAGMKLTFRATVVAGTQALELRAPVTVRLP